ncbi:MAG: glucose-1-phosphate adenylyltransferase [Acidobacteria bacterium]|nr:glucose-1-phosphate adenylyltransferase [Acidobacteriota bacterium]
MKSVKSLRETLTFILAGGQGERLYPLTRERSKPAVPFGGHYRIIDFTLSNCVNSGMMRIFVLTQYRSLSLDRHLKWGWDIFSRAAGEFLFTVPPQFQTSDSWYKGTADAVFRNIDILERWKPARVLILSGDHIYKMDYSRMIETHMMTGASVTVATVDFDRAGAGRMGVLETDDQNRILSFEEKPENPKPVPGRPDLSRVNMGVYVFETDTLCRAISEDSRLESSHDFGRDIIPGLIPKEKIYAYPFVDENRKEISYWRDIGTLDSYYEASMDLVKTNPLFNLYDTSFPVLSFAELRPPVKTVFAGGEANRIGVALDSLLCNGCIVSGGRVERSILSPDVRINSFSLVEDSILFERVNVGRNARIRRAIVDKDVEIPPGFSIGYDLEKDAERFTVTDSGIVVIPKGERIS